MLKYVDCEISYPVTVKQVIASFAKEGDNDVLKVYIPKHSTNTFALPIHWSQERKGTRESQMQSTA